MLTTTPPPHIVAGRTLVRAHVCARSTRNAGTWFTWWHPYSEDEAKGEVERWQTDKLPLDVWALDMNWRDSPTTHQPGYQENWNHVYNHPNTQLFPDFAGPGTGWFDFLKAKGLRTYFNDHPFPTDNGTAMQTSPDEVAFRWQGLSEWLERGPCKNPP